MDAFSLEAPIYFNETNIQMTKKLKQILRNMEQFDCMGSYAEKYMEAKILDCLSIIVNRTEGYKDDLFPVNLSMSAKMQDARDIVQTYYKDPPSLNRLASMVGTNECTLKSAFKKEFGTTVFQYLFDYRMKLATHYLLDTHLSIGDIGVLLGYDYQSHFCTAFQRKYGVSPTKFRELRNSDV